tara:strand:- start:168 stop:791 length:624 start_codon:yes stop_codon:yes gene_type:complete
LLNFLKKKTKDYFSQSGQDQFAYNLSGDNGFYLEIGAHHPLINSNTYKLEVNCSWKGVSIEYDETYKKSWDKCIERKNPILWNDAFKINYIDIRNKFFMPNRINYLSCDIEPPENTFNILTKIINEGLEFDFISYEHDKYNSGDKYEVLSEKFLLSKNYKISIKDVYSRSKKHKIYETWFINKDIDFENISYDDWKKTKYKKNIFIK